MRRREDFDNQKVKKVKAGVSGLYPNQTQHVLSLTDLCPTIALEAYAEKKAGIRT